MRTPKTWFGWLTRLERRELTWLLVGLGGCILLLVFLKLASEVSEGETLAFDRQIVLAFRSAADPSRPKGPQWIESVLLDLTALGGPTVIALVVLSVIGFLILQTRYWTALFIFLTVASGELVGYSLKSIFVRTRPTLVPHLREAFSSSFPSGHAMQSAIVYLTLGTILAGSTEKLSLRIFYIGAAIFLTTIVGISRLYLGVHYPTDVLAGWALGIAWALLTGVAYRVWEVRHPQKPL